LLSRPPSLGAHPDVPLKLAREQPDEARKLLAVAVPTSVHRQAPKARKALKAACTFRAVAPEWLAKWPAVVSQG